MISVVLLALAAPLSQNPTAGTDRILKALNSVRASLKLPAFTIDMRLCAAAAAHSRYQFADRTMGHFERAGAPEFTGVAPWDRSKAAGYPGLCLEAVSQNPDPVYAAYEMFRAPYHRLNFLQKGSPVVGIGRVHGYVTVLFGLTSEDTVIRSPASGESGVPTTITSPDLATLLAIHKARGPVGYPILFGFLTPRLGILKNVRMSLTDAAGASVRCFLNTPENDPGLRVDAILTPQRPLRPGSRYTVHASATTDRGNKLDEKWSFKTGK